MAHYLYTLLLRSLRMFYTVARIMLPIMIGVRIAAQLGLVEMAGRFIGPVMAWVGLPPEAGIVWATTALAGIYAGIGSMAALGDTLSLNAAQVSILGSMMLLAHNLPMEQAIVRKAGASFWLTALLRLGCALLYAALLAWLLPAAGLLQEPISLSWLYGQASSTQGGWEGWTDWLLGTAGSLLMTWLIILGLLLALSILEKIGVTRLLTRLLLPLLRFSGLEERVAPTTTVGVLLGLSYGGALIIDESRQQNYSPRTRLLALSWLSLCHSLIEDTLLIMALGANFWVVVAGRIALTLLVVGAMARLTLPGSPLYRRYLTSAGS
ncbi:nucleoside recognition domain-containing protein [Alcaligenes sp. SDU_A2]|uniref:nucleoside recognition domain-containing protein n=1 Tax=Alcaligenes sp. SDU_A2 TaxID=3136634 RepID=UPI00311E2901